MKESLYIHLKIPDGSMVLVGQCIRRASGATSVGKFRYAPSYCAWSDAFPLDPINLPLGDDVKQFPFDRESPGIPGVLLDCGPDSWGKKWMSWCKNPPPTMDVEFLLEGSGTGIGALRFTRGAEAPPPDTPFRPFESLEASLDIAQAVDQKNDDAFSFLLGQQKAGYFNRGSSLGGARPKTLVFHDGAEWLAKFTRDSDTFDNPLAEHLTMQMANCAGIHTATTSVVQSSKGSILLVKRFDVHEEQHAHFISLISLINTFSIRDRNDEDFSYQNIVRIANRICRESVAEEVFTRMVFNVAVGNTDDHMRNHGMLKLPRETQYRLTPAYDLVPNPGMIGSHAISVGPMGSTPSKDNILSAARRMGVSEDSAISIVAKVLTVTANWRKLFKDAGMQEQELAILARSFDYGNRVLSTVVSPTC